MLDEPFHLLAAVLALTFCSAAMVFQAMGEHAHVQTTSARQSLAWGVRGSESESSSGDAHDGCVPNRKNRGAPLYLSCLVLSQPNLAKDERLKLDELPLFDTDLHGAWFAAKSEIYQWREVRSCDPFGEYCSYRYVKMWSSAPVDSEEFHCGYHLAPTRPDGCPGDWGAQIANNGTIPKELQRTLYAPKDSVTIGDPKAEHVFGVDTDGRLSDSFSSEPVLLNRTQPKKKAAVLPEHYIIDEGGGTVLFQREKDTLSIGDVRTVFSKSSVVPGLTYISLMAEQGKNKSNSSVVSLGRRLWYNTITAKTELVIFGLQGRFSLSQVIETMIPATISEGHRWRNCMATFLTVWLLGNLLTNPPIRCKQTVTNIAVAVVITYLVSVCGKLYSQQYSLVIIPAFLLCCLSLNVILKREMRMKGMTHRGWP